MRNIQELKDAINSIGPDLMGMCDWLEKHTEVMDSFSGQLNEIEKTFSMKLTVTGMSKALDDHEKEIKKIGDELSEIDNSLEENKSVLRLYHTVDDVFKETKEKWNEFSTYLNVFLDMIARITTNLSKKNDDGISERSFSQELSELDEIKVEYSHKKEEYLNCATSLLSISDIDAEQQQVFTDAKMEIDEVYSNLFKLLNAKLWHSVLHCFNEHVRKSVSITEIAGMFNFLSAYRYKLIVAQQEIIDSSAIEQLDNIKKLFSLTIFGDETERSVVFSEMNKMHKTKSPDENDEIYRNVFSLLKQQDIITPRERQIAPVGYGTTFQRPVSPPMLADELVSNNDIIAPTRTTRL